MRMPVSATDNIVNDAIAYLKPFVQDSDARTLKVAPADEPVIRVYNDELCICYLVDLGASFRYVQDRDLEREEISADQLHEIGLRNLLNQASRRNARVQPYQNIFAVLMGGDFEASTILLDRLWEEEFGQFVSGDYAAALPTRDVLAFCDSSSEQGLEELRQVIARVTPTGDHLLSEKIYVRRDGTWQPQKA
jgi:uncharacterized protein YtpQ (UPF0354 family)